MKKPLIYLSVFLALYIANIYFAAKHYDPAFLKPRSHPQQPEPQQPLDPLPLVINIEGEEPEEIDQETTPNGTIKLLMDTIDEGEEHENIPSMEPMEEHPAPMEGPLAPPEDTLPPMEEPLAPAEEEPQPNLPPLKKTPLDAANLVDAQTLPIKVFLDIRYATANNFMEEKLYESDKCYLQKDTAEALVKAAGYALEEETPFYFCLYDCYRPLTVQKLMFAAAPPGFVADPQAGSNHNRGAAVDLGPCDEDGIPLPMPTDFDDFSEAAAADFSGEYISETALKNRSSLQKVMKKAGFTIIPKEWWHFDYKDAKDYPLLDISL